MNLPQHERNSPNIKVVGATFAHTLLFHHRPPPVVASTSSPSAPTPVVDLSLLLSRLREYVTVNRIRGSEFFQDFDPLRSGSIAASRFRQVSPCTTQ